MRRPVALASAIFVCAVLGGGRVLAWVEGISFFEGVVLAFWTVSTLGFGEGPATRAGALTTMSLFGGAVVGYFLLASAAFESALHRMENDRLRHARLASDDDATKLLRELNPN